MVVGGTHRGTLHHYSHRLVAFEHQPSPSAQAPTNTVILIGGLCDGFLTIPFVPPFAQSLPPTWSLAETLTSSSYTGFGSSSLSQDIEELGECVSHFRNLRPSGKVVLMGHSTGSQDIMHYLLAAGERPRIDGGIMQGGISDREAIDMLMIPELREESVRVARQYVRERRENDMLPDRLTSTMFPASISAKRWLSLVSPGPEHAGEDDYFSSDLNDERLRKTFGRLGEKKTPIFILYGENDPYVPPEVNKVDLVEKWKGHIRKGGGLVDEGSGVIPGMSHSVKEMGASLDGMTGRVVGFLTKIEDESIGEGSKESTVKHCP